MRRSNALDPAALLVDQDWRIVAVERFTDRPAEATDLPGISEIALEQDDAPGARLPQKCPLVAGKLGPFQAADKGA
jgi:hypothetical protein